MTASRLSSRLAAIALIGSIAGCGTGPSGSAAQSEAALPSQAAQELGAFPPLTDAALAGRLQAQLDAVVERDEAPAISASVILPGAGRWDGTSGTTPEGEAVSTDTVFAIASITKTVVAAAALKLSEEGVLDLDDRLAEHLPPEIAEVTNDATLRCPARVLVDPLRGSSNRRRDRAPGQHRRVQPDDAGFGAHARDPLVRAIDSRP